MRAFLKAIFFILLMTLTAACSTTSHNYNSNSNDNNSSDPQFRYGGQMTIRGQASKGTNQ